LFFIIFAQKYRHPPRCPVSNVTIFDFMKKIEEIMRNPLFKGFNEDEILKMLSSVAVFTRKVEKDGLVFL